MNPAKHTVLKDSLGRVLTLFDYGQKNQLYVMGTPYWTYPTWQTGTVQLSEQVAPMNNVNVSSIPPGPCLTVQDITNALANYDAQPATAPNKSGIRQSVQRPDPKAG